MIRLNNLDVGTEKERNRLNGSRRVEMFMILSMEMIEEAFEIEEK